MKQTIELSQRLFELNSRIEETAERLLRTAIEGTILKIPLTDLEVFTTITQDDQLRNVITQLKGKYDLQDLACSVLKGFPPIPYMRVEKIKKDSILDIFYEQDIIIDLNTKNQNGDSVLDIIATSNEIVGFDVDDIIKAMFKHRVDWTQKFGDEQNNLPLSFVKSGNCGYWINWGIAMTLLR